MKDTLKVVLAHPDKQHSFKTAKALLELGVLDAYITTVYDKPGSLTHSLCALVKGTFRKKLQAHRSNEIPDGKVKQFSEFLSLWLLILVRIDKKKRVYSKLKMFRDKVFNQKVARYCKKHHIHAVVSFDVVSAQLYQALDQVDVVKILDMSAPHFSYMCSLFEKEVKKYPDSSLQALLNTPLFDYWRKQSVYEIQKADAFLVASDFTKKSLADSGADVSRIFKCVYGLNHGFFNATDREASVTGPLRCVYVGNVTEQKGSRYLFEAIKKLKLENQLDIEFTIVGAYAAEDPLISRIRPYCTFTGHILPAELKSILLHSHVMVFPSLADGFGFSVLEAMACGVVPICSRNAGVADLIRDGENGFLIDAMDAKAICEKLYLLGNNQQTWNTLSENAINDTAKVTWANYYNNLTETLDTILKKRGD